MVLALVRGYRSLREQEGTEGSAGNTRQGFDSIFCDVSEHLCLSHVDESEGWHFC